MDVAAFSHLKPKNNIYGGVKEHIKDPLFFNHIHVENHLINTIMFLMILGDTNKPRIYQVLYYAYKTDNYVEYHAPKLNNIDIFPPGVCQVPELAEDCEACQGLLDSGA